MAYPLTAPRLVAACLEGTLARDFFSRHATPRRFKFTFDLSGSGREGHSSSGIRTFYFDIPHKDLASADGEQVEQAAIHYAADKVSPDVVEPDDWRYCVGAQEVSSKHESTDPKEYFKRRRRKAPYFLEPGESLIHGTMVVEDIVRAILDQLKRTHPQLGDELESECAEYEDQAEFLDHVVRALQPILPPLTYFGSHPGDGSDFGCWPYEVSDYEALAEEGKILYADLYEGQAADAAAGIKMPRTEPILGVIRTNYYSFECYDHRGKLLWKSE